MRRTARIGFVVTISSVVGAALLAGCTPQPGYYSGTSGGYSASLSVAGAEPTATGIKFSGPLPCMDASGNPRRFEFRLGDFRMNAEGEFWGNTSGSSAVAGTGGFGMRPYLHGTQVGEAIHLEIAGQITLTLPDSDLADCEFFYDSTIVLKLVANASGPTSTTVATTTTWPPIPASNESQLAMGDGLVHFTPTTTVPSTTTTPATTTTTPATTTTTTIPSTGRPPDGSYEGTSWDPDTWAQTAWLTYQVTDGGTQVRDVQVTADVLCEDGFYQGTFTLPGPFPLEGGPTISSAYISGTQPLPGVDFDGNPVAPRDVATSLTMTFDTEFRDQHGFLWINSPSGACFSGGRFWGGMTQ